MTEKTSAVEAIHEILKNWRTFPNTTTTGHYEFLTQTVVADSIKSKDIELISSSSNDAKLMRKVYGVFIHEITHWLDHTSTLWGQQNLISIFNAYNAWTNQKEKELWRISSLFSELGRIYLADYYTEEGEEAKTPWDGKNWQYGYGCYAMYDNNGKVREDFPFIATKFSNNKGLIKRVPISIVSLIEANAVAAELYLEGRVIIPMIRNSMTEEQFLVESNLTTQDSLKKLYNPDLAVYSVATHCLANTLGVDEVFTAYELSSTLATVCLNLPTKVFHKLKIPADLKNLFGNRVLSMLDICDRGFAFFILAQHSKQHSHDDVSKWLELTVKSAGLPSLSHLQELARREMSRLDQQILPGIFEKELRQILQIGLKNFYSRGIYGNHLKTLESLCSKEKSLNLPPILLGDDTVFDVNTTEWRPPTNYQDIEDWIFPIMDIEYKLREFQKACIAY
ncbi:MAG: hypothetical protein RLZZ04_519 [Cyanobacteriota bacterium]|jgi:hypothetical protein